MKKYLLISLIAGLIFFAVHVGAKEINLDAGETYRQGDPSLSLAVNRQLMICPLALKDCQYLEKFNRTCHYQTKCSFYPTQKLFLQTTYDKFDDFKKTCMKTSDIKNRVLMQVKMGGNL
ncbi:hypothetical protein [Sulfurimonas sp. CS5]|jgi:hypothetical protein|uniref:hypothetical protein n=1 Tax=Sulfurimonas sp. CS5 TaxID=3391145 RepID=UPI0039E8A08E